VLSQRSPRGEIGRLSGDREEILAGLERIMEERNDNLFEAAYAVWYNTKRS